MKPIKNRVHCVACNRSKMLFETEEAALRFVKFNSSEILAINGYAPTRAYYCPCCGGWHLTSKEKGLASVKVERALKHVARLKKYQLKNDLCKVQMEFDKTYRFLSQAAIYDGEEELKQIILAQLADCNQWFASIAA